jgi:microcystin-dependent protein
MADITLTPTQTFVSGDTVTPATLNKLAQSTVALTAGSIVAADIASDAITTVKILDANVTTAKILDANVTTAKLATVTAQALLPAGAVMPFARATAPAGWLIANGNAVPNGSGTVQGVTADFSALYAAVSTSFGTAGTLPNLQGIFVRGSGEQTISGTTYDKAFALKEQDELKSHTHSSSNAVVRNIAPTSTGFNVGATPGNLDPNNAVGTTATGGAETRPANIALLYCIKF